MQLGTEGNGTVSQIEGNGMDIKGKAIWVMGRAAGEGNGESEGNSQSLDAFLELKLENEKLREELRELQQEYGEDDIRESFPASSQLYSSPPSHALLWRYFTVSTIYVTPSAVIPVNIRRRCLNLCVIL